MTETTTDRRFTVPLYSVSEASRYLRLPRQTLVNWADGYSTVGEARVVGAPLVTAIASKGERNQPRLPFIGIAEAYVLNVFRRAGVPLQRIRPSLDVLKDELGPHALASNRLFTDGAEVLWNLGAYAPEGTPEQISAMKLLVPRSGQYVFNEVVAQYLKRIAFSDGYARLIRLENYGEAEVVLDPDRGYGHPIFAKAGVTVDNVLGAIRAGDSLEDTAEDYGLPVAELRDALSLSA
jgi:uncharacterized protein (DUF433 family)